MINLQSHRFFAEFRNRAGQFGSLAIKGHDPLSLLQPQDIERMVGLPLVQFDQLISALARLDVESVHRRSLKTGHLNCKPALPI